MFFILPHPNNNRTGFYLTKYDAICRKDEKSSVLLNRKFRRGPSSFGGEESLSAAGRRSIQIRFHIMGFARALVVGSTAVVAIYYVPGEREYFFVRQANRELQFRWFAISLLIEIQI